MPFTGTPADRILVAIIRILGATLLTQDRRIVEAALVATLNCPGFPSAIGQLGRSNAWLYSLWSLTPPTW